MQLQTPTLSLHHQNPAVLAANARLRAEMKGGVNLSEQSLLAEARAQTGLVRFGDNVFVPGKRALLRSLEEDADLNLLGRTRARVAAVRSLKNRLWANACYEAHPEIRERTIKAPIVLVGPLRSGTTRLHRAMATDARLQHLKVWEGFNPGPRLGSPDLGASARRDEVATFLEGWRRLSPGSFAIHPMQVDDPDEEKLLFHHSFYNLSASAMYRVPGYNTWMLERGKAPHYQDMANLLRLVSWSRGEPEDRRWVLKAPQHALHLDELLAVFPDARVIFTHRDPVKTVASTLSFSWSWSIPDSDTVSRAQIRDVWVDLCETMARRCMAAREAIPASQQHDVHYLDTYRDWSGVLRGVYDFIGMEFTPEAERAAATYVERERRHLGHRYDLGDFGLTEGEIQERFRFVNQRYGVAREV